ncbi:MAG: type II secretion system F family protein [Rhizobiaceae bacterium]
MSELVSAFNPIFFASIFGSLVVFGLLFYFTQARSENKSRTGVRKRLDIHHKTPRTGEQGSVEAKGAKSAARKLGKKTNDFYASNDPKSMRRMQMQLIQAGFLNPNALGYFMASRVGLSLALALCGLALDFTVFPDMSSTNKVVLVLWLALMGYFLPNFYVNSQAKKLQSENRSGFPDVMDLMIVASEAGLTMEASIERIAREVEKTYPTLSRQLALASLEVRAGRPLDQALRAFGERLGLEEVQGFATMIQQSKELGTSVADALRVYSDEMRHKRMMMAEEKAYALPAKLSIPVTAFILPIVIGVAVLPTAIRLMNS